MSNIVHDSASINQARQLKSATITRLQLSHFRNYTHCDLNIGHAPVIALTGHNGAGKTNILEAISLLSPGRGLRKAPLSALRHAAAAELQPWAVAAEIEGHEGAVTIGTGSDPALSLESRLLRINGQKPRGGQSELLHHLAIIWQTPQMDGLFLGSDTGRRQFLDRLVYAFDSVHAVRVSAYEQAMRERNRVLADRVNDEAWLAALEDRMAQEGAAMTAARLQLVERLNEAILLSETSFPKAHLTLLGDAEASFASGMPAADIETALAAEWRQSRRRDAAAGRSLSGPHRSRLRVVHLIKNTEAADCSTGEQKAMLLSLLLAHARARLVWLGAPPILLLDEIVAHLDLERRRELLCEITDLGAQSWVTGTDAADFSALPHGALQFTVKNAEITVP